MTRKRDKEPLHPGTYIKKQVLPPGLTVKAAAELLQVGRPALSNLLNGKAALSTEMALRLQKTFGVDTKTLLELQAQFDQIHASTRVQNVVVRTFVPSFLKITARDIEAWADGSIEARSKLPVLIRKLVHSTGEALSKVDFPGYDNAQRKGWDGWIDTSAVTPWIPRGRSGWEFGCDKRPKLKADSDYTARVDAVPKAERMETTFVFVTPRNWDGKTTWSNEKHELGDWKSVRAYDASDLEQWLEQSIPAQGWMAEQIGLPDPGAHSLDSHWHRWAFATQPPLARELFDSSIKTNATSIEQWLKNAPAKPLIICADSKDEALAFLYCIFEANAFAPGGHKDRSVVFSSSEIVRKLIAAAPNLIAVAVTEGAERELGTIHRRVHTIIVRPRNTVEPKPDIELDLLSYEAFSKGLAAMGIKDHHEIEALARASGQSPTILRRRLSDVPAIRTPLWALDKGAITDLIPIMLVGAWNAQLPADIEILSRLGGVAYPEIEKQIARLVTYEDSPVWSTGQYRGVISKLDSFFAVHDAVVQKHLEEFLLAARVVLSETDPALELPEDKRAFASLYGKVREHSRVLREGICETLVLLAVHGNNLFERRLGVNVEAQVGNLIRELLTPLSSEKLLSQSGDLPLYAEAGPQEFLKIIEDDLRKAKPEVSCLMKPADGGVFGGGCPRTGLLWALEGLAWKPEQLPRVSLILATLADQKIEDNWDNKPENSLRSIYRSWLPQTAAALAERKKALEALTKKAPSVGWKICVDQFDRHSTFGSYNHRPRWRNDASGAGQLVTMRERYEFARKAVDLALSWPEHDENTLGDLVSNLQGLAEEDGYKVWDLVEQWARRTADEKAKAVLRERIRRFAFTDRGKQRSIASETRDRAREVSDLLTPNDAVIRHEWLFKNNWVESSADELEDQAFDIGKSQAKVEAERLAAMREIWEKRGFPGIQTLATASGAPGIIGWCLAQGIINSSTAVGFLEQCLAPANVAASVESLNKVMQGYLMRLDKESRNQVTKALLPTLLSDQVVRLLLCSPFERDTWLHVDSQSPEMQAEYWRNVNPGWIPPNSPDVNETVDRLLAANRPRAAFNALDNLLEQVETSRLRRLVRETAAGSSEARGTYQIDGYRLSTAFDILQMRVGMTPEEMAQLEFLFIRVLQHSQHGIPNLERQLSESPALFAQAICLVFKRRDGGEDPQEWRIQDQENRASAAEMAYTLLNHICRVPGTQDDGSINTDKLKAWLKDARLLCAQYGRVEVADQMIGRLLASAALGEDGVWPCTPVRDALEGIGSDDLALGMSMGVYNSRGVHFRAVDGGQAERDLATKYHDWSRQLAFEYPYVAGILQQIAARYDHSAVCEDSEAVVRRRLMR